MWKKAWFPVNVYISGIGSIFVYVKEPGTRSICIFVRNWKPGGLNYMLSLDIGEPVRITTVFRTLVKSA